MPGFSDGYRYGLQILENRKARRQNLEQQAALMRSQGRNADGSPIPGSAAAAQEEFTAAQIKDITEYNSYITKQQTAQTLAKSVETGDFSNLIKFFNSNPQVYNAIKELGISHVDKLSSDDYNLVNFGNFYDENTMMKIKDSGIELSTEHKKQLLPELQKTAFKVLDNNGKWHLADVTDVLQLTDSLSELTENEQEKILERLVQRKKLFDSVLGVGNTEGETSLDRAKARKLNLEADEIEELIESMKTFRDNHNGLSPEHYGVEVKSRVDIARAENIATTTELLKKDVNIADERNALEIAKLFEEVKSLNAGTVEKEIMAALLRERLKLEPKQLEAALQVLYSQVDKNAEAANLDRVTAEQTPANDEAKRNALNAQANLNNARANDVNFQKDVNKFLTQSKTDLNNARIYEIMNNLAGNANAVNSILDKISTSLNIDRDDELTREQAIEVLQILDTELPDLGIIPRGELAKQIKEGNKLYDLLTRFTGTLTSEDVGLIDSIIRDTFSWIHDTDTGDAKAETIIKAFESYYRHAIYGSQLSKAEIESFRVLFGELSRSHPHIVTKFIENAKTLITDMEGMSALGINDAYYSLLIRPKVENAKNELNRIFTEAGINDTKPYKNVENKGRRLNSSALLEYYYDQSSSTGDDLEEAN